MLASPELVARTITAVRRENGGAEDAMLEELEVIEVLGSLEPVWDELYPAEQARILQLLIERIDVAPALAPRGHRQSRPRALVPARSRWRSPTAPALS
jgi:hypothetical protein